MDQRIVAGLGNIYVCEALFRARLDPFKAAARLATKTGKPTPPPSGWSPQIKAVLRDAIRAGGSTLRDYQQADGALGCFQNEFAVYGREGEPCVGRAAGASCAARRRAGARPSIARPASADSHRHRQQAWSRPWPTKPSSSRPRAASA